MRFMFVNNIPIHVTYGWKPALLSDGHEVIEYGGYEEFTRDYGCFKIWQDIHKIHPDCLIFIGTGVNVPAFDSMIEACQKLGILLIFHAVEDPYEFEDTIRIAKGADIIYSLDEECVSSYIKDMGKQSSLFPPAINISTHFPGTYNKKLAYDLIMIATCYPQHKARTAGYESILGAAIALYEEKGVSVKVYGNWWNTPVGIHYLNYHTSIWGGLLDFKNIPSSYTSSQISLGVQCLDNSRTQSSQRPFEAIACGSFHITQWTPSMDYYFEEGVNIVTSRTKEETKEKISYYLNHPESRKSIIHRGQELVYSNHTYEKRIREIVIPDIKRFGIYNKWR